MCAPPLSKIRAASASYFKIFERFVFSDRYKWVTQLSITELESVASVAITYRVRRAKMSNFEHISIKGCLIHIFGPYGAWDAQKGRSAVYFSGDPEGCGSSPTTAPFLQIYRARATRSNRAAVHEGAAIRRDD